MAERRRNHFIPRFLLKKFASKNEGPKSWIWQVSAGDEPVEISTRDAAVAKDFYGDPSTGVEDAFSEAENRFAEALRRFESEETGQDLEHELRGFVWTLAMRTRALRYQATELIQGVITQTLSAALSVESDNTLAQKLRAKLKSSIDSELTKLPPDQQRQAAAMLGLSKDGRNQASDLLRLPISQKAGNELLRIAGASGSLDRAGMQGQIKGLYELLDDGVAPQTFRPCEWSLERHTSRLILGDGCVFVIRRDGWVGPLLLANGDWDALYLPISPYKVLVGYRNHRLSLLSTEEINTHSAELSWSHIFSCKVDASVETLASNIGKKSASLLDSEISAVLTRIKNPK